MPFHSADVWVHPHLFKLDETGTPLAVSGVPPDYFSTHGQLWGHPVYRWDIHRETRYQWWIRRFARILSLFDYVRIDHFRGLVAYWEVPANEPAGNVNAIHNIPENCVVFTGTHDNNTVRGWFENEASSFEKRRLELVFGREPALDEMHWDMIRLAMMSPARMCIIPVQDVLGLGSEARINCPGRTENNWLWMMSPGQFAALPQRRLRDLIEAFGRL